MENVKVIKLIGKALGTGKSSSLSVLNTFCIQGHKIVFTNLDTTVTLTTSESGTAIIDFKQFDKTGNIDVSKSSIPLEDFPGIPQGETTGSIEPDIINDTDLSTYKIAVSKDENRACLQGISISENGICATDGHIAVYDKLKTADCDVILMPETVTVIELLKNNGEVFKKVDVIENKYIRLESVNSTVFSKLIEGPYPDWHKVIPKSICGNEEVNGVMQWVERPLHKTVVSYQDIQIVKNGLQKILPFVFPGGKYVKNYDVVLYKNYMYAKNSDSEKHVKIKMPCQLFEQAMAFNCKLLIEVLSNIKGDGEIKYSTMIGAVLFNDNFLLMPLRIKRDDSDIGCRTDNEVEQFYLNVPFIEMNVDAPAIKTVAKKVDQKSAYFLFSLESLFGITTNSEMPGIVKQLSETEYKSLAKMGVNMVTEMETADSLI